MSRTTPGVAQHIVITGAKSRSHLVHIAAYVRNLLEDPAVGRVKISFIEADAFLSAPAVRLVDLVEMLPHDDRLEMSQGMPGFCFDRLAQRTYISVGAPGVGMLARLVRANRLRRFAVVVTDEGIGTYGSMATRRSAMERQGAPASKAFVKAAIITTAARLFTTTRWAAYQRESSGWAVAPAIATEFRRYVGQTQPGTNNLAVVLTQPFADLGLISEEAHLNYVDAMCAAAQAVGLDPVIRPHPAEDIAKYGARVVMDARGTAELDPRVAGAALVLGGPSTALVNVSAMYGSPVVWVSIPGLEHLDTVVSLRQAEIFNAFLGGSTTVSQVCDVVATRLAHRPSPS